LQENEYPTRKQNNLVNTTKESDIELTHWLTASTGIMVLLEYFLLLIELLT
jgi:hypothetical protein